MKGNAAGDHLVSHEIWGLPAFPWIPVATWVYQRNITHTKHGYKSNMAVRVDLELVELTSIISLETISKILLHGPEVDWSFPGGDRP